MMLLSVACPAVHILPHYVPSVAYPALHISPNYVAICGLSRSTYFPTLCCHLWPIPLYTFPQIMLPSVACPALHIFSHYVAICGLPQSTNFPTMCYKLHDFREKVIDHKMCDLISSTFFYRKISHSKKNSAIYHHSCLFVVV